ncbi:3'(2'),5'-bisphosphate nucleotidase CysQ [Rhodobacteraceae bacterium N5(2021)]|uniref:3'(2'),5'-bisphosphate nucleotidase CysQ n=1 Tax=Gymnodinialimonas phycosphaerae TaxID=2841589 RepID=A0A975TT82_9RHOB|nr:3'(2'),5'-bisphosphate nucleotidase CysQ [Gymnodinialimonas phycosphaerae]MBY4894464.1 3'(2'),5'-bisphosphate nucleotidase CysQ [Gymnodinialimonas phycosphaerae]
MPGPEEDLKLLIDAALRAGEIAKQHFGTDLKVYDKGVDDPVTVADIAIDAMLHDTLRAARPDYGWLSEETEDTDVRLSHEHVFICDPIDGTRAFIEGGKSFSHSLSVVRDGAVTAAAVFLPMHDKMYAAHLGGGSTLNNSPVRVTQTTTLADATALTTKGNMQPSHWHGDVPVIGRAYRPSLAYRMSLVGEGRFDAMMTFRPTWEWDIAAGALIIAEAGGVVTDGFGRPLQFNGPSAQVDGVLAASGDVHAQLLERRVPPPH